MEALGRPCPVDGHDGDAQGRGHAGGQHGAEDAHPQGKHEHVVQDDVGQAAGHGGQHGQLRVAVISHKAEKDIVQDEGGGEQQQDLEVGGRHVEDGRICPQEGGDKFCAE